MAPPRAQSCLATPLYTVYSNHTCSALLFKMQRSNSNTGWLVVFDAAILKMICVAPSLSRLGTGTAYTQWRSLGILRPGTKHEICVHPPVRVW